MLKRSAQVFLMAATWLITSTAIAGSDHVHDTPHGGIHVESKQLEMEVVAKTEVIQIYVHDTQGKPVKLEGATAKVTLLNGTEKSEFSLLPVGEKLEAKGAFKVSPGTKGVVLVTLAGKPPSTARFTVK